MWAFVGEDAFSKAPKDRQGSMVGIVDNHLPSKVG
jgi:hypothetical protein